MNKLEGEGLESFPATLKRSYEAAGICLAIPASSEHSQQSQRQKTHQFQKRDKQKPHTPRLPERLGKVKTHVHNEPTLWQKCATVTFKVGLFSFSYRIGRLPEARQLMLLRVFFQEPTT